MADQTEVAHVLLGYYASPRAGATEPGPAESTWAEALSMLPEAIVLGIVGAEAPWAAAAGLGALAVNAAGLGLGNVTEGTLVVTEAVGQSVRIVITPGALAIDVGKGDND